MVPDFVLGLLYVQVCVCVCDKHICMCFLSLFIGSIFLFFSCLFSIEKEKESVVDLVGEEVGRSWGKENYDQNKLCGKKTIFNRKRKKWIKC